MENKKTKSQKIRSLNVPIASTEETIICLSVTVVSVTEGRPCLARYAWPDITVPKRKNHNSFTRPVLLSLSIEDFGLPEHEYPLDEFLKSQNTTKG